MEFQVPKTPKIYTRLLTNLLGVDFTSIMPAINRASNMINLINNNGYLESRPGYDKIGYDFGVKASIILNNLVFKAKLSGSTGNDIQINIINPNKIGAKLSIETKDNVVTITLATDSEGQITTTEYDISNLTSILIDIELVGEGSNIIGEDYSINLENGKDNPINGCWNIDIPENIFIVHVENVLYKLDETFNNPIQLASNLNNNISQGIYINNKLLIFDGKRVLVYGKFGTVWEIKYLDEIGYVPTTVISRNPDGTGGKSYEDINLIQSYRINSFLSKGVNNTYYLDTQNIDDIAPTVTILTENGTIEDLPIESYNKTAGTVTFSTPPPQSPVDGRDNIFIRFSKSNAENISYINKCTIITTYGYDGNNNRIFATGNSEFPNIDWFSAPEDGTYWPAENFTRIGFQPIKNYLKLNDGTLAVQKEVSDTDATIYYRKSAIYNNKEVFPISSGVNSIGCISSYANSNLLNDPLTLTNEGIYSIIGSNRNERFAMERSYFIKDKLLQEENLHNGISITFKNKYYLAINDNVYIADSRYKSEVKEGFTDEFQYEWYYWENIPVRIWFEYNNELYFGTKEGMIVKFNDSTLNYNTPMKCVFETAFLDLHSITSAKTIKKITVISKPTVDTEFTLGYITDEDTGDITTQKYTQNIFPRTLQEKEKIKKFMFIKLFLTNNTDKKMNFYQIAIEYIYAGNYRGD